MDKKLFLYAPVFGGFTPLDCKQSEADALIRLYNNCGGVDWTDNTNWLTDTTVNNWFGITTAGGRVTKIELNFNNVVGNISYFCDVAFSAVESLKGQYNASLTGDIANLANLTACTYIRLGDTTDLSGDIADLAGMTQLVTLILQSSTSVIDGDIADIATLTSLTTLDLHSNGGIIGDIADIVALTALVSLSLGNTQVTGDIGELDVMTNLNVLNIYGPGPAVTGDLADLNALNLTMFGFSHQTGVNAVAVSPFVNIISGDFRFMELTEGEVDIILEDIYDNRAVFTETRAPSFPSLRIEENTEPSGVYQDGDPPTTGKEFIYEVVEDPESEGFNV